MKHKFIASGLKRLPTSLISRAVGKACEISLPKPAQRLINTAFAKAARINIEEAAKPLAQYDSLNALFTRTLKADARTFSTDPHTLCAPCDGRLSDFGIIQEGQILQAKGQSYRCEELLGTSDFIEKFQGGFFFIIYLSPKNYHRVHTPFAGEVTHVAYVPGGLLPVNRLGQDNFEKLFVQNERLTSFVHNTAINRLAAVVKVGATCVGKISVVYDNFTTNQNTQSSFSRALAQHYPLHAGDELGCFNLGSTVVLLLEGKGFRPEMGLEYGQSIKAGSVLGTFD